MGATLGGIVGMWGGGWFRSTMGNHRKGRIPFPRPMVSVLNKVGADLNSDGTPGTMSLGHGYVWGIPGKKMIMRLSETTRSGTARRSATENYADKKSNAELRTQLIIL